MQLTALTCQIYLNYRFDYLTDRVCYNGYCSPACGRKSMMETLDHTLHAGLNWSAQARPRVRLVGRFPLAARQFPFAYRSKVHALHLHDYHGVIRLEDHDYALEPGTLTLSPAHERSSYDLPVPGTHWCIHFDPYVIAEGDLRVKLPLVVTLKMQTQDAVNRFEHIARLHRLSLRSDVRSQLKLVAETSASVALQELLLWFGLLDELGQHHEQVVDASQHQAVHQLLDLIENKLHERLVITNLCQAVGMSQNYLAKLFREHLGQTISQYILSRRIETAGVLLGSTNLPVKQVALRVGIPDAQYFNKQFRRLTGVSPTGLRTSRNRRKG